MKKSIPWLYALAAVVVLLIIASLFMNPAIRIFRMPLMLARECFLWVKTEWRFHFFIGVGAVLVSFGWALYFHEPMVFARSGALMTVAGVFMTYRGYFRRIDDPYTRDTGEADRRAFSRWHPIRSKEEAKLEDRKAFRCGLISIMIGTVLWAYGDCLFSHWPNKIR
jgi:hypothetical protein